MGKVKATAGAEAAASSQKKMIAAKYDLGEGKQAREEKGMPLVKDGAEVQSVMMQLTEGDYSGFDKDAEKVRCPPACALGFQVVLKHVHCM